MAIFKNTCTLSGLQIGRRLDDYNTFLQLMFFFIIGSKHGFIQNLRPLKRSRRKGVHWFDFHLQTSSTKVQRMLASNAPAYQQIQHFQNTNTPVFLKNFIIKQDKSDWIFNQQSNVSVAPNSDITFSYKEQL